MARGFALSVRLPFGGDYLEWVTTYKGGGTYVILGGWPETPVLGPGSRPLGIIPKKHVLLGGIKMIPSIAFFIDFLLSLRHNLGSCAIDWRNTFFRVFLAKKGDLYGERSFA